MRAPVSVVIPTLDVAARIGPCIAALVPGLTGGLIRELILADGGSSDGIERVAEALGAVLVTAPAGRGTQLRAGCATAGGSWLMVIHADTVLPEGWETTVQSHIREHPEQGGYFRLSFDATGAGARWTAGWANLRSSLLGLPYGDQGLVLPRGLYEAAGGYQPIPLMEDVALVRALGRGTLRRLPGRVTTSAARYAASGWFRRGVRNLGTIGGWFLGVPVERLAERYRR